MSKMVGQDMLTGMGFIGTKPGMYRMTPPYTYGEAEGTAISVASKGGPFKGMRVMGRTEQETTTGAQLLDISKLEIGKAWNNSANTARAVIPVICSQNTAYTVSVSGGSFDSMHWVEKGSEEHTTSLVNTQMSSFPFTRITTGKTGVIFLQFNKTGISISDFDGVEIMLNAGSSALPWEPYTGGIPSPSPEYPQELVSVGDGGSVEVSITDGTEDNVQSITINTPNGLPGIPVTSGGNYTDQNGQQWICDEVDLERGVKVQRVKVKELNPNDKWIYRKLGSGNNNFQIRMLSVDNADVAIDGKPCFCNILPFKNVVWDDNVQNLPKIYAFSREITVSFPPSSEYSSLEVFKQLLKDVKSVIYYVLATPIETPLTTAEIAAYRTLHTNSPVTTITNSDNAHMIIKYKKGR